MIMMTMGVFLKNERMIVVPCHDFSNLCLDWFYPTSTIALLPFLSRCCRSLGIIVMILELIHPQPRLV